MEPEFLYVKPGENINLTCKTNFGTTEKDLQQNMGFIFHNKRIQNDNNKMNFIQILNHNTMQLEIANVTKEEDEGEYFCEYSPPLAFNSSHVEVIQGRLFN